MSDENEELSEDQSLEGDSLEGDSLEGDYVEIDWAPLQAAINAMTDEGLDIDDNEVVRDHLAALLASLLLRVKAEHDLNEEQLAEAAAEVAALAIQIAMDDEEVPTFEPTEDFYEKEDDDEPEGDDKAKP